jgi:hypothetical protein
MVRLGDHAGRGRNVEMDRDRRTESGLSLVGILVVILILGTLAALTVAALNSDLLGTSALSGVSSGDLAGGGTRSGAATGPGFRAGATTASCIANVRTVEQAAATKHASDGVFPATVAELVTGHWLDEAPVLPGYALTIEVVGGRPTGKVLVNGSAADQGCAAPPRPGP